MTTLPLALTLDAAGITVMVTAITALIAALATASVQIINAIKGTSQKALTQAQQADAKADVAIQNSAQNQASVRSMGERITTVALAQTPPGTPPTPPQGPNP